MDIEKISVKNWNKKIQKKKNLIKIRQFFEFKTNRKNKFLKNNCS